MENHRVWQVHANVNTFDRDSALRVTITFYDENGDMVGSQTWRRHVRALDFLGSDWQAYSAVTELAKMMADAAVGSPLPDELDAPLF